MLLEAAPDDGNPTRNAPALSDTGEAVALAPALSSTMPATRSFSGMIA
ncbi:MAG TPA: hypothetical protein PLW80_07225 [Spirochaetales bacterium]|nr:hypothetical protein [Spirochaetales bacterium]